MALRIFAGKGYLQSDGGRDTPVVRNVPMNTPPSSGMNKQPNLQEGCLVLIKEDNLPSMVWRRGLVQNVYCGSDDLVRMADVKTASGVLKYPISKLCLLPNN
jgi:hypothetical protein